MDNDYKRLDLKTGFLCNNNCIFCTQEQNKVYGNRSFEEIKSDLVNAKGRCKEVLLTGGEVAIRKDFFDIVKFANDLGYENIQVQTNGRIFSSLDFCKKTISAGASSFQFLCMAVLKSRMILLSGFREDLSRLLGRLGTLNL